MIYSIEAYNNSDFTFRVEFVDSETGQPLDFTGAFVLFQVRDNGRALVLDASTTNGKITMPETGAMEISFPESEMASVCPSQYNMGALFELNGETNSLFTGTLNVLDGVAKP